MGFPGSSIGKESACNARDPAWIPGSGRSPGGGISYPLQYSWASSVTQLVKNSPALRETWVWSLDWEGPLEKGMATDSSILAWKIYGLFSLWGREESDTAEQISLSFFLSLVRTLEASRNLWWVPELVQLLWERIWQYLLMDTICTVYDFKVYA